MIIRIGFSPCPNDTFIFDALVHQRIDCADFIFEPVVADIEELNRMALTGIPDMIKMSYGIYNAVQHAYVLLDSGSAVGVNCGPLLVCKKDRDINPAKGNISVAVPGMNTTANRLLSMAYPAIKSKKEMLFSDIEEAVCRGEYDAGLIIHESRFTYQRLGLKQIADLGIYWQRQTALPLPLGGICIKRSLPDRIKHRINHLMKASVLYAIAHPEDSAEWIRKYANTMETDIIHKHIQLYVNHFTVDLGIDGRRAVQLFIERTASLKADREQHHHSIFLNS